MYKTFVQGETKVKEKQSYTMWLAGTRNRYQVWAISREHAISQFAHENQLRGDSGYILCRKSKKGDGLYLALANGERAYGSYNV